MSADVDSVCGAAYGSRSPERVNRRNGYRKRDWDTRVGTIQLAVPKLRQDSEFTKLGNRDAPRRAPRLQHPLPTTREAGRSCPTGPSSLVSPFERPTGHPARERIRSSPGVEAPVAAEIAVRLEQDLRILIDPAGANARRARLTETTGAGGREDRRQR